MKKQSGFSIAEVMITIVILGIVAYGAADFFGNHVKSILGSRTTSSRDSLKNLVQRSAGDGKALKLSSEYGAPNTMLDNCVNGTGGNGACIANTPYDFILLDATGQIIAGRNKANPAVFDTKGAPCAEPPSSKCPIITYSSFRADCGGTANCKTAVRISVIFTVQQADGVDLKGGTPMGVFSNAANPTSLSIPLNNAGGNGILNALAKWSTTTTLIDSGVEEDPATMNIRIGRNVVGTPDAYGDSSGANVGIGLPDPTQVSASPFPNAKLDVNGAFSAGGNEANIGYTVVGLGTRLGKGFGAMQGLAGTGKMMIGWNSTAGWGETDFISNRGTFGSDGGFNFYDADNDPTHYPQRIFTIMGLGGGVGSIPGSVGIGLDGQGVTSAKPEAKFHVRRPGALATLIEGNSEMRGNLEISNELEASGNVRFGADALISGTLTSGNINSGNINSTGTITAASDLRLKKDIQPYAKGLEEILSINPVSFRFNGLGGTQSSNAKEVGVIAQDLEQIAPELVSFRSVKIHPQDAHLSKIRGVNYSGLSMMLINAVKEIVERISGVDKRVEQLEKENSEMRVALCELQPALKMCGSK